MPALTLNKSLPCTADFNSILYEPSHLTEFHAVALQRAKFWPLKAVERFLKISELSEVALQRACARKSFQDL